MSGDWLAKWETLAELNRRGVCSKEVVIPALESSVKPVVRMALKVLMRSPDRTFAIEHSRPFLYAYSGEIRHEAALLLADCGDRRFEKLVTGAFADFSRLAKVSVPEHEETIRAILATNPPDRQASALREILRLRAKGA